MSSRPASLHSEPESDHSESESDVESESSTVVYDHESFDTFRNRVLLFVGKTIWPDAPTENIAIERMRGGGFNRIIGLKLLVGEEAVSYPMQHILRVPRFDAAQVDRDVAVLRFLQLHSSIPAPRVIKFDETENNELKCPYMVQNRIPGTDLYKKYPELDHDARCRLARELGCIFHQMLAVRSSMAGRLVLSEVDKNPNTPLHVVAFQPSNSTLSTEYTDLPSTQPVKKFLTDSFQILKEVALKLDINDTIGCKIMDEFASMATQLDSEGWLVDVPYTLAHLDLAPRNILVNLAENLEQPIISAVLDWDSAVLAPMFMSCAPPVWLWAWQDDEDEDERLANDKPPTPEGCQIKQLFEAAAGHDYLKYAYEPSYRLARRLVRFAIDGVRYNEDFKEADMMLQEWSSIHQSSNRGVLPP